MKNPPKSTPTKWFGLTLGILDSMAVIGDRAGAWTDEYLAIDSGEHWGLRWIGGFRGDPLTLRCRVVHMRAIRIPSNRLLRGQRHLGWAT